ncbi:MAG TPA: acyl-CoA dehydrogenase C-terminal domain-containing protein, partial [Arenimonas sp.]|nr:acyl-CoA dehydrogenase C-terminal domain-containing protein [Arenimonas sp.]
AATLAHHAALAARTTAGLGEQMARGDVRAALANAPRYLTLVGHLCIAWNWLRQALAAQRITPRNAEEANFIAGKLAACRWFFVHELPTVEHDARLLAAQDRCALDTPPEVF